MELTIEQIEEMSSRDILGEIFTLNENIDDLKENIDDLNDTILSYELAILKLMGLKAGDKFEHDGKTFAVQYRGYRVFLVEVNGKDSIKMFDLPSLKNIKPLSSPKKNGEQECRYVCGSDNCPLFKYCSEFNFMEGNTRYEKLDSYKKHGSYAIYHEMKKILDKDI